MVRTVLVANADAYQVAHCGLEPSSMSTVRLLRRFKEEGAVRSLWYVRQGSTNANVWHDLSAGEAADRGTRTTQKRPHMCRQLRIFGCVLLFTSNVYDLSFS